MFDDRIYIGVSTVDENASTVVSGITGSSVAFGDSRAFADNMVAWVNANGGMAGREVVPVFYELQSSQVVSGESVPAQEACSTWTQDNQVFAAIIPVAASSADYVSCLSAAGVPLIAEELTLDSPEFAKWGDYYYAPTTFLMDRMHTVMVDEFLASGFFATGDKVGILYVDRPSNHRVVVEELEPMFDRAGIEVADTIAFSPPFGIGDPWEAYALRFKTAGVDRVIHVGGFGWPVLQFSQAAESQDYHPLYGMNSTDTPSTLQGLMPESQLRGSEVVSWIQANDVDAERDPGTFSAANELCFEIMKDEDLSSRQSVHWSQAYCSAFMFLKEALDAAPALNPKGLKASIEAIGTGHESPRTFGTYFGPGRHDGVSRVGRVVYDVTCSCFRYDGPIRDLE